jgi:hypothetical protein
LTLPGVLGRFAVPVGKFFGGLGTEISRWSTTEPGLIDETDRGVDVSAATQAISWAGTGARSA